MNEREKLEELINQAIDTYATMPLVNGCRPELKYFLADHLLANGVIVPPCKVGDRVYSLAKDINSQIFEGVVYEITQRREESYFRFTRVGYYGGACSFEDFGKTVFLSRDLAEEALEAKQNDKE